MNAKISRLFIEKDVKKGADSSLAGLFDSNWLDSCSSRFELSISSKDLIIS